MTQAEKLQEYNKQNENDSLNKWLVLTTEVIVLAKKVLKVLYEFNYYNFFSPYFYPFFSVSLRNGSENASYSQLFFLIKSVRKTVRNGKLL